MKPAWLTATVLVVCAPLFAVPAVGQPRTGVARPVLVPGPGAHKDPVKVTLKCATPGAVVRYTLDGTVPGPESGTPYTAPVPIDGLATLTAVAFA
jgi:hypothetical protein